MFHAEVCVSPHSGHHSLQFLPCPPALPKRAALPFSVLAAPFPPLPSSPAAAADTVAVIVVLSPAGRLCGCGDTPLGQHSQLLGLCVLSRRGAHLPCLCCEELTGFL